ncbi:MAG: hypothetical protein GEV28_18755 [Actinophytocola sp.]|uniref:hypothetical protein n=1 Tax=Actinophytocola sp. TaxID=1872138 RepID=UPI001323AE79|nr:hypothetical protein [Actinophytocola sp.]MPZ82322.1 hypothetical protein [Actinophytocola sp.]
MKKRLPWVILAVAVLVAAVVVTLVLTANDAPVETPDAESGYDLSTPERAAESFARAAAAGDGEALLELTCLDDPTCVAQQGAGVAQQVDEAKRLILASMADLAAQLDGAVFGKASEAAVPGAMEVSYRTPGMAAGERRSLMFVKFEGRWLYVGSAGASAPAT